MCAAPRVLLAASLIVLVASCEEPSSLEVPDRGPDLRGPVGPPALHDLVSEHREELGLSVADEEAIRAIADDARAELDSRHDDIRARRAELAALLGAENPDRDAINRAIDALGTAETRLRRDELRVLLDIRERLTPAQREALVALSATVGHRAGPRHPRPGPDHRREDPAGDEAEGPEAARPPAIPGAP